jgi:hypothetical protein
VYKISLEKIENSEKNDILLMVSTRNRERKILKA